MRTFELSRTEAEWLVDLLEDCDPAKTGTWRFDMASEIRQLFGMNTREQEMFQKAVLKAKDKK